jgi:hypothetical protein
MVTLFNATFNNISVISWLSVLSVEETEYLKKTTDLLQVTDKLYHIMSYRHAYWKNWETNHLGVITDSLWCLRFHHKLKKNTNRCVGVRCYPTYYIYRNMIYRIGYVYLFIRTSFGSSVCHQDVWWNTVYM